MKDSHSHVCSVDPTHEAWSPKGWMVGEPCLNFVHGRRCTGVYVATGQGGRAANAASAARQSVDAPGAIDAPSGSAKANNELASC